MSSTFTKIIAVRYLTAKKQSQWVSFISLVSVLGMVLGVAALITVLSVMNGFDRELKSRLLSTISHATLQTKDAMPIAAWRDVAAEVVQSPDIVAAAPVITRKVMLVAGGLSRAVNLNAVDLVAEQQVSNIVTQIVDGNIDDLQHQPYGMVIGSVAAEQLGVFVGQKVNVILPQLTATAMGVFPRTKRFSIVAVFEAGAQVDGSEIFIRLEDGRKLFRYQNDEVQGLRLRVADMLLADDVAAKLSDRYSMTTWYDSHVSLFNAIAMEKVMMTVLLLIVVTVASFNVVSIMSMLVNEKRGDIAVLRVMGASQAEIRKIFMMTGLLIGMLGCFLGMLIGIFLATNIGAIVASLEQIAGAALFDPSVYYISQLPSHLMWQDVMIVVVMSIVLSVLSSYYPAKRAGAIHASEALQYE
jgi:lipoprotein-releasing system permease protein